MIDFCRAKLALTRSVEHAHDEGFRVCLLFKLLRLTIDFLVDLARFQLFRYTVFKLYRKTNLRNLTAKIDD